jgi:hypothetical protein
VTPDSDPLQVADRVCAALESLHIRYSIGGSIASSLSGEPRSSLDIDIVADVDAHRVPALVSALEDRFYVEAAALERAVRDRSTANVIDQETAIKVDLFIAGGTPLDEDILRRRVRVEVGGRSFFVHSPEDILLQKLRWFRRGGELSDRQWRDVLGIVRVQGTRLDRAYLRHGANRLGVADLLARIIAGA